MATLTINGSPVSADPEQTILEAARAAGIADIPTLCWYPKLPLVGNCRICLVSVEGQFPTSGSLGYQHRVGMSAIPAARAASRIVCSGSAETGLPLMVRVAMLRED